MSKIKFCEFCRNTFTSIPYPQNLFQPYPGYCISGNSYECPVCHKQLVDTVLDFEDLMVIKEISTDVEFLEAMIKLKEENPIDFQIKLTQLKTSLPPQIQKEFQDYYKAKEFVKSQKTSTTPNNFKPTNTNIPKCPTCGSTDLKKISNGKKVAKVAMFGIFGMGDNGKTWQCKNCGNKF